MPETFQEKLLSKVNNGGQARVFGCTITDLDCSLLQHYNKQCTYYTCFCTIQENIARVQYSVLHMETSVRFILYAQIEMDGDSSYINCGS